jgi:methyltransferase
VSLFYGVLAFVVVQRLAELAVAAANARRLRAAGAIEIDAAGYKWFVSLHAGWLAAMAAAIPAATPPAWPLLGIFAVLQPVRLWIVASLGRRWTTRLIVMPDLPLVTAGPYRYLRHPNYLVVTAEIAILPLAFGGLVIAAGFSAANLGLILRRIRLEDAALARSQANARPADAGLI